MFVVDLWHDTIAAYSVVAVAAFVVAFARLEPELSAELLSLELVAAKPFVRPSEMIDAL